MTDWSQLDDETKRRLARDLLLKELKRLAESDDQETAHYEADEAVLNYLADPEIRAAYDLIDKWYA